ncbi:hypothetical protein P7H16_13090 [Paenibacillus larvae]|nr:hypothetical protein [Paenibacillus larvae]MDT2247668.1 hypothetical protein [Paenibacillus larvae]
MLNHLYAKIHDFRITGDSVLPRMRRTASIYRSGGFLGPGDRGQGETIYPNELTLDAEAFIDHIQQDGVTFLEVCAVPIVRAVGASGAGADRSGEA